MLNIRTYLLSKGEKGKVELEKLEWLFETGLEEFMETVDMKLVINDKMHFCVRINRKVKQEYDEEGMRKSRHSIDLN